MEALLLVATLCGTPSGNDLKNEFRLMRDRVPQHNNRRVRKSLIIQCFIGDQKNDQGNRRASDGFSWDAIVLSKPFRTKNVISRFGSLNGIKMNDARYIPPRRWRDRTPRRWRDRLAIRLALAAVVMVVVALGLFVLIYRNV